MPVAANSKILLISDTNKRILCNRKFSAISGLKEATVENFKSIPLYSTKDGLKKLWPKVADLLSKRTGRVGTKANGYYLIKAERNLLESKSADRIKNK